MASRVHLLRGGLDALYRTGAYRALAPLTGGRGIVFMLHHVVPQDRPARAFDPNGILRITPQFLAEAIAIARAAGFATVDLDEARRRLAGGAGGRFAVFTLDDGYRDNLEHALPVFRRLSCPFTVYVTSGAVDRTARFWWIALERAIAAAEEIAVDLAGRSVRLDCADDAGKTAAWRALYWPLRAMGEAERLATVAGLAARHGVGFREILDQLVLSWDEVRRLAAEPLAAIGAHTVSHAQLARLDQAEMVREMVESAERIAAETGRAPAHFAYPYGDPASAGPREFAAARAAGFATAVTTRKGLVYAEHADHLTALPRVSLNGDFQAPRYLELYLSGVPFALANRFRRVNAA